MKREKNLGTRREVETNGTIVMERLAIAPLVLQIDQSLFPSFLEHKGC